MLTWRDLISLVSVPQKAVEDAATALEQGIERAALILNEMAQLRPFITPEIARFLGMDDVPQTRRMAGAIIANALVFHQRISGLHANVKPLHLVCGPGVANPQGTTLEAWSDILQINYWAIFAIAKDILEQLPPGDAARILSELRETAQQIDAAGLNNHHARREARLICEPDAQLRVRPGRESRAAELWPTASRAHLNRDFTFGSQALAVAFTEFASIGGTVWPNIGFDDNRFDYAFAVWGNSTLGLLAYWWHSSRQQSSKARMTRLVIPYLPTLDLRTLTADQLTTAQAIFDDFRDKDLLPAYLADADPNPAELDRRVICDLLGFNDAVYQAVRRLAAKWCAEPSVHGGKPRPQTAQFAA